MADVLKKFGRYFLLDQIAQGGMAEIYRARLASADGAGRLIVIKRIQAGFGANSEFIQMFKSEIKVTMGFNHPNIVQLYDFGEESHQPYIAMEFVDGRNVRQFLTRFSELKQSFPVDLAAYIVEQAASGLHYAHHFKDKITGQPLNIVHRDISPQNILISYEGNVKVIDFGIAKAAVNSESTRAGVIKGKPSYLSPEQISGDPLDGRSDIFALGIVLWELLAGRKLFAGETVLAVLKLIESCNTHVKPPSTINPKVPKELDYIVLKALAKQREKRFQTGEEFQRALHKFLYNFNPEFNPGDLSYYAKDLFKNEIVEDRKRIQRLNDKVEQLIATDRSSSGSLAAGVIGEAKREDTTTVVEPGLSQTEPPTRSEPPRLPSSATGNRDVVIMDSASKNTRVELEGGARGVGQRPRTGLPASPQRLQTGPQTAPRVYGTGNVGGQRTGTQRAPQQDSSAGGSRLRPWISIAAVLALVALGAPMMGIRIPYLSDGAPAKSTLVAESESESAPANRAVSGGEMEVVSGKSVLLRLNVTPGASGTSLLVNGRTVDPSNPVLVVPLDSPLELVAERAGYRGFRREFVLDSQQVNGLREWMMEVQLEPEHYGFLTLRTTPSADATIYVEGQPWLKKTPLQNEKLPVGTYHIKLKNEVLGMEKDITVTILEGRSVAVDEKLEIKH